jgi:type III secretion system chaperone SycN
MASFSVGALRAIETFAASLGLPVRPARDGSFSFVFDRSGTLSLTPSNDGARTLVSLARVPPRHDLTVERRALDRAGLNPTTNQFLHAGLAADGSLVFAVSVEDGDISLPALESCFEQLTAAHDAIA